eukprot:symbB.v1.2.024404.t1/scaffold2302.1/size82889/2
MPRALGTQYHEDFARAFDLLAPGASVVADRVLDPMSPEFMWQLSRCNIFEDIYAVDMEDDWVMIATGLHGERLLKAPEEVIQMRFSADEAQRRTFTWRYRDRLVAGATCDPAELEAAREAYQRLDLVPTLLKPHRSPNGSSLVLPSKKYAAGFMKRW